LLFGNEAPDYDTVMQKGEDDVSTPKNEAPRTIMECVETSRTVRAHYETRYK
jgi:hypothetical protein